MTTGSTQVPQGLVAAQRARFPSHLRSTETTPIAVYTIADLAPHGSTASGLLQARIVSESGCAGAAGEVVVRGPNVFFEYWGNQAATSETLRDGWYFSGDIGTRDADGYFFIHDRKKNMIISASENIYPAEIERVLHEHPAVAEAAVIGRADPRWQEVPVAYVVRKTQAAVSADEILAHVGAQLARFKVPREIVFVDSLPRNALGKVQHFLLSRRRNGAETGCVARMERKRLLQILLFNVPGARSCETLPARNSA